MRKPLAIAGFAALVLAAGVVAVLPASASVDTQAQTAHDTLANCQLLAAHSSTSAQRTRAQQCVTDQAAILRLLTGPTPTPSGTTPAVTTPPVTPSPTLTTPPTGWPDASTTGVPAGTVLRATTGRTITTSISGEDVAGCITIGADNITISNSRIRCAGEPVNSRLRTGVVIRDTELDCLNTQGTGASGNFAALRLNVHGCENGFSLDGRNDIEDSYIHDIFEAPGGHTDGIQVYVGAGSPITIRHNRIENLSPNATSAIIADSTFNGLVIDNNRLVGGGFVLRCPTAGSGNVITDNVISGGYYGPWTGCEDESVVSGNQLLLPLKLSP